MNEEELARAPPSWSLARVITLSHSASAPTLYQSTPLSSTKETYRSKTGA